MFGKIAYQINFRVLNSWLKTLLPLTFHKTLLAFTPAIPIIPLKFFHIYIPCHGYKSSSLLSQTLAVLRNPPSPASSVSRRHRPCFQSLAGPVPCSGGCSVACFQSLAGPVVCSGGDSVPGRSLFTGYGSSALFSWHYSYWQIVDQIIDIIECGKLVECVLASGCVARKKFIPRIVDWCFLFA